MSSVSQGLLQCSPWFECCTDTKWSVHPFQLFAQSTDIRGIEGLNWLLSSLKQGRWSGIWPEGLSHQIVWKSIGLKDFLEMMHSKNYRERLARYSNRLTFLTRCRSEVIVPNGLWVVLPVCSKKSNEIATRASQALLRERISDGHRQKAAILQSISMLESDLSQLLTPEQWSRLDSYCQHTQRSVHLVVKERQTLKFETLKLQQSNSNFPSSDLTTANWWCTLALWHSPQLKRTCLHLASHLLLPLDTSHIRRSSLLLKQQPMDWTTGQQMHWDLK